MAEPFACPGCGRGAEESCPSSCPLIDNAPYVCPGCHAVGGEKCAPGCIDAEIEREREDAIMYGDYDYPDHSDDEETDHD
jgi:hypothetical protein